MRFELQDRQGYAYTGGREAVPGRPSLIFVHGAQLDHSAWALQSRYFAHHGWNVLAVDLPGHGRSEGPPLASVEALADWVVALAAQRQAQRPALVGHSLGALVALEAAARLGEGAGRLALLGASVPMPVSAALLEAARSDEHAAMEMINGWSFSAGAQLGGNRLPGVWMTGSNMRLMERARPGTLHTDLAACNAYAGGIDAARRVRAPTLLLLGARDLMTPPRNARALGEALGEVRVVTLPECGHAMMTEQPDAVLDALREFLA